MGLVLIVLLGVLLLGMWFMRSNRSSRPGGYYDSRDYRSGGNIGGERSTYDSPDYRSGGSIGGGPRTTPRRSDREEQRPTYDDPDYRSGGSIGG